MHSKKHPPTASQRRIHEALRVMGPVIPGFGSKGHQLHHIFGASAKHNKVWIGQDAVLILPWELHDVHSDHPLNVTHHKKAFEKHFGEQKDLCITQYIELLWSLQEPPSASLVSSATIDDYPSTDVMMAITDYHK